MKKLSFYLTVCLVFFYSFSGNGQGLSWQILNSGTTQHLWGVSAPTATACYVVGYGGVILKSNDSGSTWIPLTSGTTADLYEVKFTDMNTGYVIGDNGTALKTTDGGVTWAQMSVGTSNALRGLNFINSSTGYICGGISATLGIMLKTTDGGVSWSQQTVGSNGLYALLFSSPNNGITSNYDGDIFRTSDAGLTWNYVTSGTTGSLQGGYAIDSTAQLLVGHNGTIKRSISSGMTWTDITSGTSDWLNGIDFYNSTNGCIAGGNLGTNTATILSTNNGGLNWTTQYPSGASRLNRIDFYDQNLAYAVGLNGTIIRSNSTFSASASTTVASAGCNGTATISVMGGVAPYTYMWPDGSTSAYADSLCSGSYTIYVFDANGDSDTLSFTISNSTSLTVSISSINASSFGICDGAATASAAGGTGIYSYLWNTGQTTSSITGLCAGIYSVSVTDSTGSTGTATVVISQPSDTASVDSTFVISTVVTNVTVFANCDGTATVNVSGGTPPYSYLWSNGDTTTYISGLCSNVYFVTVVDANGQSVSASAFVSEPIIIINNPPDSIPNDTINIPPVDTCIINYGIPVDSAYISAFTVIDASNILITWIIWQNGASATFTALYQYTSTGTIAVSLTLNCSGDFRDLQTTILNDAIYINNSTAGITNDPSQNYSIRIYPNPATERFSIELPQTNSEMLIQILNPNGQLVFSEQMNRKTATSVKEISISRLPKGIYFIQISSTNKILSTEKLIIN